MATSVNQVSGGMDTARVPAAASQREADARTDTALAAIAYLRRTGNDDLLDMLGLVETVRKWTVPCANPGCERQFTPRRKGHRHCSAECVRAVQAVREREARRARRWGAGR